MPTHVSISSLKYKDEYKQHGSEMKVAIFIISGNNLSKYEEFQKNVWKSYMNTYNHIFDCKIIYSGKKGKLDHNEWTCEECGEDKVMGLNKRVFKAFKNVQHKYDFYTMVPLSMFVNFKNFIRYLRPLLTYNKPFYGGQFGGSNHVTTISTWSSFVIFNNKSLNIFLKEGVKDKYMKPSLKFLKGVDDFNLDVWISHIMHNNGVKPYPHQKQLSTCTYNVGVDPVYTLGAVSIPPEKLRDMYDEYALIRFRSPRYGGENYPEEKRVILYLLEKVYNKKLLV